VKENIIPSECEAVFDCRILPGQTTTEVFGRIKRFLEAAKLDKLNFETVQSNEPSESPLNTPLHQTINDVLREYDPQCSLAPIMLTGGTDSRFFRKIGSVCYGFHPVRLGASYSEMMRTVHGANERISIENLVFGTSVLYNVAERFLT